MFGAVDAATISSRELAKATGPTCSRSGRSIVSWVISSGACPVPASAAGSVGVAAASVVAARRVGQCRRQHPQIQPFTRDDGNPNAVRVRARAR